MHSRHKDKVTIKNLVSIFSCPCRDGGRHRRPNPHEGRTLPIRPRVLSVDRQTLHPATNTPRPDPSEAHHPGTPPRSEPEKPQAGPSQRPKSAHEASPSHRSQSSSETSESQPQSQQGPIQTKNTSQIPRPRPPLGSHGKTHQ